MILYLDNKEKKKGGGVSTVIIFLKFPASNGYKKSHHAKKI